jgi:predicted transcriptional regulator
MTTNELSSVTLRVLSAFNQGAKRTQDVMEELSDINGDTIIEIVDGLRKTGMLKRANLKASKGAAYEITPSGKLFLAVNRGERIPA